MNPEHIAAYDSEDFDVLTKMFIKSDLWHPTYFISILTGIQFVRVLLILQASKIFGPMLKTLFSMLGEVARFLLILSIIVFAFIVMGRISFFEFDELSSISKATTYMVSALFGEFDFGTFDGPATSNNWVGYIYLMVYLFITTTTLLNFLIAILSNTYEINRSRSKGLYLSYIVNVKHTVDKDKNYSSLVYSYTPFIFFLLPVYPFLLWKERPKLNSVIMHILYVPVLIIAIMLFIIFNLLMIPISYVSA